MEYESNECGIAVTFSKEFQKKCGCSIDANKELKAKNWLRFCRASIHRHHNFFNLKYGYNLAQHIHILDTLGSDSIENCVLDNLSICLSSGLVSQEG